MAGNSTALEQQEELQMVNKHQRFNSEDLRMLKRAQSSSSSINKIVEGNSPEEDLLINIDNFISSIERKLDRVEVFFGAKNDETGTSQDAKQVLKDDDSIATLQNLYDTLITIKNSVFSTSVNLETFNTILDEHYGGLLSSINASENLGFHEKLLTALHFLDAKINQFNNLVEGEARAFLPHDGNYPSLAESTYDSIKSFEMKFYNYEHAITKGAKSLLHYNELPFPWRENPHIVYGYRFHSNHLNSLKSICSCHNETANIWSHIFGAMVMLYVTFVQFPSSTLYHQNSFLDNLVIYLFLAASVKCLLSSSFWHTFNGTANLYLRKKFACIDYTGITVLITASVVTTEYASLYYHTYLRTGFILFSLFCGICGFFFNWSAYFDRPESKPFRIAFYITLSGLGAVAFVFLAFDKGMMHALKFYLPITRSAIWYLTGVGFYSALIPERFRKDVIIEDDQPQEDEIASDKVLDNLDRYFKKTPNITESANSFFSLWWVDYIFASHNIWHVFVLLGVLGHYSATCEMFSNIHLNK